MPELHNKLREFHEQLSRLGLSAQGPAAGQKVKRRTIKRWVKQTIIIGGVALVATTVWTITYDKLTRGVIEAKREHSISDVIKQVSEVLATVVFLTTTGTNTWTKDASWNNTNNTVEGLGAGGTGGAGATGTGGSGGGGGAYAKKNNVSLSGDPSYTIGAGGSATDTSFNSGSMVADAGANGTDGSTSSTSGGLAANSTGDTKFNGGSGAGGAVGAAGGGGGGAAGLNGAGGAGSGSAGGTGDNGNTAAGANGTQWDATHGSGGGGAGGTGFAEAGATGGLYGAGGGGGQSSGGGGGAGRQGLIVLTWSPAKGAPSFKARTRFFTRGL